MNACVFNSPLRFVDPLGLAPGDWYSTPGAAGSQAIRDINPSSVGYNVEYAGWVYQGSGGNYSYTAPIQGTMAGSNPGAPLPGATSVGIYHTHGADVPGFDNNIFSPQDTGVFNAGYFQGYLGTPSGTVQQYDPFTGASAWTGSALTGPACGGR